MHPKIEEHLKVVSCMQSAPRLHSEGSQEIYSAKPRLTEALYVLYIHTRGTCKTVNSMYSQKTGLLATDGLCRMPTRKIVNIDDMYYYVHGK
jgi:hypothetical protein